MTEYTGDWDLSTLPPNIVIGAGCWVERKASFDRFRSTLPVGLRLGDRVRVYTWTEFNIEPQGQIEVGADSVLVGAIFMCAQQIRIGERVLVSYHVTIADSDFHPIDPEARRLDAVANAPAGDPAKRPPLEARPVVIGDDVWIGIGALLLKGVRIGRGAKVLAGAVVTRDVAPGEVVAGNPARPVGAQP